MIVLGIDTGIALTGYALIDFEDQTRRVQKVLDYGVIETKSSSRIEYRLRDLYDSLNQLIDKYNPKILAIEELFYFKNQKTFVNVLQARGVTILACTNRGIEVNSYTPLQVKQALTGYGRASKSQIQDMVKLQLNLDQIPKPDDAADALAICLTHIQTYMPR